MASHDDAVATGNKVDLYVGNDANWWVGIALLAVAAMFVAWAALRPVVVDVESESGAGEGSNT